MPQNLIQEGSPELEPFRELVLSKFYYMLKRIAQINLTAFFVNLFLLGFKAVPVSGGGPCPASTSCRTSRSLVDTESEDSVEGSTVEVMRRFSAVKLPRRRELALTVTNKDEEDEADCCEPKGVGWTNRKPGRRRCRLTWGPFWLEFSCLDIRMYMVHEKDVNGKEWNNSQRVWNRMRKWCYYIWNIVSFTDLSTSQCVHWKVHQKIACSEIKEPCLNHV